MSLPPKPQRAPSKSYYFHCAGCRAPVFVEPNQSGRKLDCACGATNVVPSLINLHCSQPPKVNGQTSAPTSGQAVPPLPFGTRPTAAPQPMPPCPFCGQPMHPGRIIGDRYRLKWLGAEYPLTLGIWALGGDPIGHGGFLTFVRTHANGWRCRPCGKIVIDERA